MNRNTLLALSATPRVFTTIDEISNSLGSKPDDIGSLTLGELGLLIQEHWIVEFNISSSSARIAAKALGDDGRSRIPDEKVAAALARNRDFQMVERSQ